MMCIFASMSYKNLGNEPSTFLYFAIFCWNICLAFKRKLNFDSFISISRKVFKQVLIAMSINSLIKKPTSPTISISHSPYWSYMIEFDKRKNSVSFYGEDIGAARIPLCTNYLINALIPFPLTLLKAIEIGF